jgi:hypothetical protein
MNCNKTINKIKFERGIKKPLYKRDNKMFKRLENYTYLIVIFKNYANFACFKN